MAYGVTDKGFIQKPFSVILEKMKTDAEAVWGEEFDTTPDSVYGQLASIFSDNYKDLWDLGQTIETIQDRDTAEGIYLDKLARLIGLSRIRESSSTGFILFSGEIGALVPVNTTCSDVGGRKVITLVETTLNRSNCYTSVFSVFSVLDSETYTLNVEGNDYSYTTGSSATESEILQGLLLSLQTATDFTTTLENNKLTLTYITPNNLLTTTNTNNLTVVEVGLLVNSEAVDNGALIFDANTIVNLVSTNLKINSVTNPRSFETGRAEETDAELRLRMEEREQSTGTATKPAIEASISEISGVSSVLVIENNTLVDDATTGVPKKSYETFITGGSEDDIAPVLWKTKPATGNTVGSITKVVLDRNGDLQTVRFSRKSNKYAWVKIDYSLNSEEDFPVNGEEDIKLNVVSQGNNMYSGEDFEPTKFYGAIYKTPGVIVNSIQIAVTNSLEDTPTYQSTRISVSEIESLTFNTSTVTFT